jgi:hypothetical protein
MIGFKFLIDLADQLGVIQLVKDKLLRQPDPAADKLVVVLAELSKVYGVIEGELVKYLSLYFDHQQGLHDERAVLLTLEGGQLRMRVGELAVIVTRSETSMISIFGAGFTMH